MIRIGSSPLVVLTLLTLGSTAPADEWGTWNDLPDNLLESEQTVRSLDDLSNQLDQLIQANRSVDDNLRRQLLRHWLDQINSETEQSISLDQLIEMSADWENEELSEWYDELEDYLEEQTRPIEAIEELEEEPLDDDSVDSEIEDEPPEGDDDPPETGDDSP